MGPKGIETVVCKACGIHDVASRPGGGRTFAPLGADRMTASRHPEHAPRKPRPAPAAAGAFAKFVGIVNDSR